jgi:hypothetical protein
MKNDFYGGLRRGDDGSIPKISPKSIIELVRLWPYAKKRGHKIGECWRIGYYSKKDGPYVIHLVGEDGGYKWMIDWEFLEKYFKIIKISSETSYYGIGRAPLGALKGAGRRCQATRS